MDAESSANGLMVNISCLLAVPREILSVACGRSP